MSFQCVYCDKEHDVKSNIFNLGGNVCKICAKLFGLEVLSIPVISIFTKDNGILDGNPNKSNYSKFGDDEEDNDLSN